MKIETWEQLDQASRYSDTTTPIDIDAVAADVNTILDEQVKEHESIVEDLEHTCRRAGDSIDEIVKELELKQVDYDLTDTIAKLKDLSNELGYI